MHFFVMSFAETSTPFSCIFPTKKIVFSQFLYHFLYNETENLPAAPAAAFTTDPKRGGRTWKNTAESLYIYRLVESTMYILFSLTRFPLLSARVDELDFCFFSDAGTEIFVEDHVHFIFSNALSLAVSQGRQIRFLFFFRRRHRDFCRRSCTFYFL